MSTSPQVSAASSPPLSAFFLLKRGKTDWRAAKPGLVCMAVEAYLAELQLDGAQRPLASVALLLAESLEAAPPYARARLARELHDLLTELEAQAARRSEIAERRERRARQRAWVSDGRA
jgi:hypothetical protein